MARRWLSPQIGTTRKKGRADCDVTRTERDFKASDARKMRAAVLMGCDPLKMGFCKFEWMELYNLTVQCILVTLFKVS